MRQVKFTLWEPAIEAKASILASMVGYLAAQGIKAYLVGGVIRDVFLGRETRDIDIAVAGDALAIARDLAGQLGGSFVLLDAVNRLGRVVVGGEAKEPVWTLDVAVLRGNIEHDLGERDFTINAIAVDIDQIDRQSLCFKKLAQCLIGVPVIDPFNGLVEINQGVIRAVSPRVFTADPVRLLRAVRLKAELDFSLATETEALMKEQSGLAATISGERVREELLKLLAVPRGGSLLSYLDELKLLTVLIAELEPARESTQPVEHQWRVLEHSLRTAAAVDYLLRAAEWEFAPKEAQAAVPWSAEIATHFEGEVSSGSTCGSLLKLAAALHDIAKPQTKVFTEEGRWRFLEHDQQGAEIVATVLERLRFSVREIRFVQLLVRYHLRPTQLSQEGMPTRRALYRYFRDTGEAAIDILFLSLADHLATRGAQFDLRLWQEHCRLVAYVLVQQVKAVEIIRPVKLIDGNDLVNLFGLKPGPALGALLEALREAQAAGEINSREEALAYVRTRLGGRS